MLSPAMLTVHEAIKALQAGELKATELWNDCSARIERHNPRLNAIITQIPFPAAAPTDTESKARLWGIPVGIKDLFETRGVRTSAGSLFYKDHIPSADSAAVEMIKGAGGVLVGKTNTHEIALGVTTANPHFGICRNPWNTDRTPGGSSGGSAVAVATGMALAALGTDTGGSIRIPAALCGVVGLKPTYGRVSLRGVIPLSWNLDHAGPIARCVRDAAIILQVIAGYDEEDPSSANVPVDDYTAKLEDGAKELRIGLAVGDYVEDTDEDVLRAVERAAQVFRELGARVSAIHLPYLREAALANGLITQADAAAYHATRLAEKPGMFGTDVRERLETGRDTPLPNYILARRTQAEIRRKLARVLRQLDVIILPSTPTTAPPIDQDEAVVQARRLTRFTAPFNLSGLPALSLPCGFDRQGLPIGLQMVAAPWNEVTLLRAARAYERESGWAVRTPPDL